MSSLDHDVNENKSKDNNNISTFRSTIITRKEKEKKTIYFLLDIPIVVF